MAWVRLIADEQWQLKLQKQFGTNTAKKLWTSHAAVVLGNLSIGI